MVQKDTTITPANASTLLTLDSLAVQRFVDSMVKDSTVAAGIINFYNSRNYQYAWFNEEGLTEQAEAFWTQSRIYAQSNPDSNGRDDLFHAAMDSLVNGDTATSSNEMGHIELSLTYDFFRYIDPSSSGNIDPETAKWYIPAKKVDPATALDSFLTGRKGNWRPLGQAFYRLRNKLQSYSALLKAGGWPVLDIKEKSLKKGIKGADIEKIRKRLQFSGDLSPADTSTVFDIALEQAIKRMQKSFGLAPSGVVDHQLLEELNVPVEERIKQMLINLQRMKWMPIEDTEYILANIPEYRLQVFQHDSIQLAMRIVVGRAANHTVIFSDRLKYIVFSPYWNIPSSIVRNEILPAIKKDKSYLARHHMEITGHSNGLPLIRQKPGSDNALGKVKFLFPNRFNIYFHDTPARHLFDKHQRAFSHGCIRLQNPFGLAKLLLTGVPGWNDKEILQAMNRSRETWVTLEKPVPVYIVYFTSWVDKEGLLHFAKDIYGHDRVMATHLFKG
ncbi:MAG TPA: L,D-transpeptidase family protein [Puia sp.]|nr:L,D-transpeptidase family protein [Puia sp.]